MVSATTRLAPSSVKPLRIMAPVPAAETRQDGYLDLDGDRITNAIAFFDSIEFTDFWNRIAPT
jgi:hypothetical protein